MVDLKNRMIYFDGKAEPIVRFDIVWSSQRGLHNDPDAAIHSAEELGMPVESVRPVVVARSETLYECL